MEHLGENLPFESDSQEDASSEVSPYEKMPVELAEDSISDLMLPSELPSLSEPSLKSTNLIDVEPLVKKKTNLNQTKFSELKHEEVSTTPKSSTEVKVGPINADVERALQEEVLQEEVAAESSTGSPAVQDPLACSLLPPALTDGELSSPPLETIEVTSLEALPKELTVKEPALEASIIELPAVETVAVVEEVAVEETALKMVALKTSDALPDSASVVFEHVPSLPPASLYVIPKVRAALESLWGHHGSAWADNIPNVIKELMYNWGIEIKKPLLSSSSVLLRVNQHGSEGTKVLKISPNAAQIPFEAGGLWSFAAVGLAPKPFQSNSQLGALLMEEVSATPVVAELMPLAVEELSALLLHMHQAPTPPKPNLQALHVAYLSRLENAMSFLASTYTPVTAVDLHRSIQLVTKLSSKSVKNVVVHGDLNPTTVLRKSDGLLVTAPKPLVGDPGFDIACYALSLNNLEDAPAFATSLARTTGTDPSRVHSWVRAIAADKSLFASFEKDFAKAETFIKIARSR